MANQSLDAIRIVLSNGRDEIVVGEFGRIRNAEEAFRTFQVALAQCFPESYRRGAFSLTVSVRTCWDEEFFVPELLPWEDGSVESRRFDDLM